MSHPDPCYDSDNSCEDDMNYDEIEELEDGQYNEDAYADGWDEEENDVWDDEYDDSMDGDFDSVMRDVGWGTDEDYGYYGEDY